MEILCDKPEYTNSYYDDRLLYDVIVDDCIFVFGSNEKGYHGKGAAEEAAYVHGMPFGIAEGFSGKAYAIPTKNADFYPLKLQQVKEAIDRFKIFMYAHPELCFFITRVGCGYARFKDKDIAPLFKGVVNCWLPSSWEKYLDAG